MLLKQLIFSSLVHAIEAHETFYEIVVFQSDFDHPECLCGLAAEAWNYGVFDSGAKKTMCGQAWFDVYVSSLSDSDHAFISLRPSKNVFKFGDGNHVTATTSAIIPETVANRHIQINTDIMDKDILLLPSGDAMKKAGMTTDFKTCLQQQCSSACCTKWTLLLTTHQSSLAACQTRCRSSH